MSGRALAERIDALLPQTQCTKCGYAGCMPYAEAIAADEAEINQCPPGGAAGIAKLARLLGREGKPLNPLNGAERRRSVALIDEARCIGCTLCIQACPVDAIVGAAKCMHTVISELCTGCDLCVPPCPVDCIDMLPLPEEEAPWTQAMADAARERFQFHNFRLNRAEAERAERLARKAGEKSSQAMPEAKKAIILAAVERAKARKAGIAPQNTDALSPQVRSQIAAIDARRAAAKKAMNPAKRQEIFERLHAANPEPRGELEYRTPFELLIAVILSAQATDKSVNLATRELYQRANTPQAILALGMDGLIAHIQRIGLYRTKAKNILATCELLLQRHGGEVPQDQDALEALPGVGRKTANVVLNIAFGHPTIAVDTHVFRVGNRSGIAPGKNPLEVEQRLMKFVPPQFLQHAHHWLILHGRYVCKAAKPECAKCLIADLCEFRGKTGSEGGARAAKPKSPAPRRR